MKPINRLRAEVSLDDTVIEFKEQVIGTRVREAETVAEGCPLFALGRYIRVGTGNQRVVARGVEMGPDRDVVGFGIGHHFPEKVLGEHGGQIIKGLPLLGGGGIIAQRLRCDQCG